MFVHYESAVLTAHISSHPVHDRRVVDIYKLQPWACVTSIRVNGKKAQGIHRHKCNSLQCRVASQLISANIKHAQLATLISAANSLPS